MGVRKTSSSLKEIEDELGHSPGAIHRTLESPFMYAMKAILCHAAVLP